MLCTGVERLSDFDRTAAGMITGMQRDNAVEDMYQHAWKCTSITGWSLQTSTKKFTHTSGCAFRVLRMRRAL